MSLVVAWTLARVSLAEGGFEDESESGAVVEKNLMR